MNTPRSSICKFYDQPLHSFLRVEIRLFWWHKAKRRLKHTGQGKPGRARIEVFLKLLKCNATGQLAITQNITPVMHAPAIKPIHLAIWPRLAKHIDECYL